MKTQKTIIGKTDKVDFPKLSLYAIDVKIDTGAYTSAIHCKNIEEIDSKLYCRFLDVNHPQYTKKKHCFDVYNITSVRSSNGEVQLRYTVHTEILIFNKIHTITLSLSARDDMRFPVLIGRKFLNGKFIVDPQLENQSYTAISK